MKIHPNFPQYTEFDPKVPVWCVTPDTDRCIHRFFDTPPFSPSGRYLICFRMPFEDRLPAPGDIGNIVLVDLHEGTEKVVAETRGWEPQMGANVQWGADDETVIYNDVDTDEWVPFAVRLNPHTGKKTRIGKGVYHVSPDGRYALASSPERMRRTQYGYGVVIPDERVPRNLGDYDKDGLWITDVESGDSKLLLSLEDACKVIPDARLDGTEEIYGFHSKWNVQGDRLIFTIRRYDADHPERWNTISDNTMRFDVLTMKPDGTDVHNAIPSPCWKLGGHHNNWYPDGKRISMNLRLAPEQEMSLMKVNYDGSGLEPITEAVPGSGHPTVHPNGKNILTDTYTFEANLAYGDGTTPLRWIDLDAGTETALARIRSLTGNEKTSSALRLDPHPAWDRDWKRFAFNACPDGTRRVYVADMSSLV